MAGFAYVVARQPMAGALLAGGGQVLRDAMKRLTCSLSCLASVALFACMSERPIDTARPAADMAFDRVLVERGARLAAIGNCADCHTAAGGKSYAGGFPVHTPFGTVYGTNITPDPETGIGRWPMAAFVRAMREGVDPEGHHLYPAFPYDYFTRMNDEDVQALYAFFMTREPVNAKPPPNTVSIPRPFIAIWKSLYFEPGRFRPDPARDAQWNRGAYLALGLGHCSACHTPHNKMGAEKKDERWRGGEAEGWYAPALDSHSTSPVPWNEQSLSQYLRDGVAPDHAVATGPMRNVVRDLSQAQLQDIAGVAGYIASLDTRVPADATRQAARVRAALPRPNVQAIDDSPVARGERVYVGACAGCHDRGRASDGGALPMPLAIAITLPTPSNLVHIVRNGILPREHEHGPWMPPFDSALTDAQLADLAAYLRSMSGLPPWNDVPAEIRRADGTAS